MTWIYMWGSERAESLHRGEFHSHCLDIYICISAQIELHYYYYYYYYCYFISTFICGLPFAKLA
jgi:hypothetical protein